MEKAAVELQQALEEIVRSMVLEPGEVRTVMSREGKTVRLDVRVAEGDIGRVIGVGGRTARSLRTILGGMARVKGVLCNVNVPDEEREGRVR